MRVTLKSLFLLLTTFAVLPAWHSCRGQDTTAPVSSQQPQQVSPQQTTAPPPSTTSPSSTLDDTVDAGEMDDDIDNAPRKMASWQEYRGPHFTAKAGLGFLVEADAYAQNDVNKEQIKMLPAQRLRDFRFVFGVAFQASRAK